MATPKGMRRVAFKVDGTDAVHVCSDDRHIWLQLRRNVPTERDIGRSSFKAAVCLQPGTADKLGLELCKMAQRNKARQKAKKSPAAKSTQPKAKQQPVSTQPPK